MSPAFPTTGCIPAPEAIAARTRAWAAPLVRVVEPDLRALYIYGSALAPEFDAAKSDINVLVVVTSLPMRRLSDCAAAIAQAEKREYRFAPVILTQHQITTSVDVFPIEFLDLTQRRALLEGTDVLSEVRLGRANLRHQCEYELRAQLVGLRRALLRYGAEPKAAGGLLAQVAGSTATLCRALLQLRGETPPESIAEVLTAVERLFGVRADRLGAPSRARLEARGPMQETRLAPDGTAHLAEYIDELENLIAAVDAHPVA